MKSGLYFDSTGDLEYVVGNRHDWWWDGYRGMNPSAVCFTGPERQGKTFKLPIEYVL